MLAKYMTSKPDPEVEKVLDRFAETMFRLMLDHHQRQAIEMAMTLPQAQALRLLMGGPRSVMIALTERGRRAVESFRQRRHTIISGALGFLDDLERAQIVLALSKMVGALEQYEAGLLQPTSAARKQDVVARRAQLAEKVGSTAQTAPPVAAAS